MVQFPFALCTPPCVVPISFVSDELPLPQRQPLQYIAKRGELQRGGGLRFRGMPLGRHRDRDPDGTLHPAARVDGQPDTSARIAGLSPQGNDSTRSPPPARSSPRTPSRSRPPRRRPSSPAPPPPYATTTPQPESPSQSRKATRPCPSTSEHTGETTTRPDLLTDKPYTCDRRTRRRRTPRYSHAAAGQVVLCGRSLSKRAGSKFGGNIGP